MLNFKSLLLLTAFVFSTVFNLSAQKNDNLAPVDIDFINSKFSFSPVEGSFPKDATFRYNHKIKVRYLFATEIDPILNASYYTFPAKYKNSEEADYSFELNYELLSFKSDKDTETELPSAVGTPVLKSYKRSYKVVYRGIFSIYKRDGKEQLLVRRVVINDGTQPQDIILQKSSLTKQEADYFSTKREIDYLTEAQVGRVFESQTLSDCKSQVNKILDALYRPISYKASGTLIYLKKKKRNHDYTDFDTAFENYKLAMKAYIKDQSVQADSLIQATTEVFEKLLKSNEPRIDSNVQLALKVNLAWCYYWKKEYAKSKSYIEEVKPILKDWNYGDSIVESLTYRLGEIMMREKLTASKEIDLSK